MKLTDINKLSKEELQDLDDALDPFSFENYCGACIYFQTEDCPFIDKALSDSDYKKEFNCKNFWD